MVYLGSKRRLAKDLIPILMEKHTDDMLYVEPFVGGANLIDKIPAKIRIGCDSNPYLIALLRKIRDGWIPDKFYSKEEYLDIKDNKDKYPSYIVGFAGFIHGFSGQFFSGYHGIDSTPRRPGNLQKCILSKNNLLKQAPLLKGIKFFHTEYNKLSIKQKATIYCDPPYKGTGKYRYDIDHDHFWYWAEELSKNGHHVYVSEYQAPEPWKCVFEKNMNNGKGKFNNDRIEKLFTLK